MVNVVGEVFDVVNAGISVARGNYSDAALDASSAIPFIGNITGAGKFASRVAKVTKGRSVLANASKAAFKAADDAGSIFVKNKHLNIGSGNYAKFNTSDIGAAREIVQKALRSPNAKILPNPNIPNTFRVVTDLGKVVGTKGQTSVRVVVGFDGKVINAFPVK